MKKYFNNLYIWFLGFSPRIFYLRENPKELRRWILIFPYHAIDVFVNTLRGGDPRISISQSMWVDRRDYKLNRIINWIANMLFHKRGPSLLPFGEGTNDDLSFSDEIQYVLTVLWIVGISLWIWGY